MKSDKKLADKIVAQSKKVSAAQTRLSRAGSATSRTVAEGNLRREQAKLLAMRQTATVEVRDPVVTVSAPAHVAQAEKQQLIAESKNLKARAQQVKKDRLALKGRITPEQEGVLLAKEEELSFRADKAQEGALLADRGLVARRAGTSAPQTIYPAEPMPQVSIMQAAPEATPGTTAVRGETIPMAPLEAGPSTVALFDDTPSYMQEEPMPQVTAYTPPAETSPRSKTITRTPTDSVPPEKWPTDWPPEPTPQISAYPQPEEPSEYEKDSPSGDKGPLGPVGPSSPTVVSVPQQTGPRRDPPNWSPTNTPIPPGSPALTPDTATPAEAAAMFAASEATAVSPEDLFISASAAQTSLPASGNARKYLPVLGAALFGAWVWYSNKGR